MSQEPLILLGVQNQMEATHNHRTGFHCTVGQMDHENRVKWISEWFVNKPPFDFKIFAIWGTWVARSVG